ncbi:MAG: hypothetical protein CM1200mP30_30470 [Pseudomonadota bacterium]|nr:MAG: hypothetical protein CM1200mP30_30470 [Pseudomonadota bacterium]
MEKFLEKKYSVKSRIKCFNEGSRLIKSYGGLKAVDDVSFEIYTGEIFALVGDNGQVNLLW